MMFRVTLSVTTHTNVGSVMFTNTRESYRHIEGDRFCAQGGDVSILDYMGRVLAVFGRPHWISVERIEE